MRWLTKEQIAKAAKTKKGAIKSSALHWYQFATCTKEEFIEAYDNGKVSFYADYCALCHLYVIGKRKIDKCKKCPIFTTGQFCDNTGSYWHVIMDVRDECTTYFRKNGKRISKIDGRKFRKFQRLALEFSQFIGSLK